MDTSHPFFGLANGPQFHTQRVLFETGRQPGFGGQAPKTTFTRPWTHASDTAGDLLKSQAQFTAGGHKPDRTLPPGVGTMSGKNARPPSAPAPLKKQKNSYGEGAGFPKGSQNGWQQGHLFANEAPARDPNQRTHTGYGVDISRAVPGDPGFRAHPDDPVQNEQGQPLSPYDTRAAKGRVTGHWDPAAPLYYGTTAEPAPGEHVSGSHDIRLPNGRLDKAQVTPDPQAALDDVRNTVKPGTPGVYRVQPTGPVSAHPDYIPGDYNPRRSQKNVEAGQYGAVRSSRPFRVINRVQFPQPGQEE